MLDLGLDVEERFLAGVEKDGVSEEVAAERGERGAGLWEKGGWLGEGFS